MWQPVPLRGQAYPRRATERDSQMKFLAMFECAFAVVIAYLGVVQFRIASDQAAAGLNATSGYVMAVGSLLAAGLLVVVALHALRTNRAHRGTHALPFIILALTASASLFIGRAA